jgi:hypothetical protein
VLSGVKTGDPVITGPFRTLRDLDDGESIVVTKETKKSSKKKDKDDDKKDDE